MAEALTRYLIRIEYDGTGLVGWQRQDNGPSVQQFLEDSAEKLTGQPTAIQGSGRTDSGVHALGQAAQLDVPAHLDNRAVMRGLNAWLRSDQIAVLSAEQVGDEFNARFDAIERRYLYRILDRPVPSAINRHRLWHHKVPLDETAMHQAAQHLVGRHDFTSFRATQCQANSPVRTVDALTVSREGDEIHIIAIARSFLHHQIRNFAGSLSLVGRGKWTESDLKAALEACDRSAAGQTAPAHGLYLTDILYPEQK
jgi:tRNA pseudouridine38-40 synthase